MSKGFGPTVKPVWFKPSERKQELLIVSEPYHWVSHWDVQLRRSRRCGGELCYLCHCGMEKQLRVVLLAIDREGKDTLFELRERHREKLDKQGNLCGLRVKLWRAGSARNSPIEIQVGDFGAAVERDISRLIDSLGLPPINVELGSTSSLNLDLAEFERKV